MAGIVKAALAGLARTSGHRLAEHWAEYFGAPPPPRTSRCGCAARAFMSGALPSWLAGRIYRPPGSPSTQKDADQRLVFGVVDWFRLPAELAPDGSDPEMPVLELAPPWLLLRALKVCWSTTPV
jgi:hypothetical protein